MSSSKSGFLVGTCCDHVIPLGVAAAKPGSGGKEMDGNALLVEEIMDCQGEVPGSLRGERIPGVRKSNHHHHSPNF